MPQTMEAPAKQANPAPQMETPPTQATQAPEQEADAEVYEEIYPNRKRITRTMCEALANNGLLDEKYELIDGVIILKMPVNPPHRIALILLRNWLLSVFGVLFIQTENPILLPGAEGESTEPQPDIAVTQAPTTDYVESNPGPQDVSLVVEVASATLRYDLNRKALLYARFGIPEYWIMDVGGRCLRRHRLPTETGYQEIVILSETESVSPLNRAESILIGELMPAPRPVPA